VIEMRGGIAVDLDEFRCCSRWRTGHEVFEQPPRLFIAQPRTPAFHAPQLFIPRPVIYASPFF